MKFDEEETKWRERLHAEQSAQEKLRTEQSAQAARLAEAHAIALRQQASEFQKSRSNDMKAAEQRVASILQQAAERARMETKAAVEAVREEMEETQQSAMDELKAESEQLISSFDAALKKLQVEKDTVEEAFASCRVKLEESEDRNYDAQLQVKRACKIGASLQIRLCMVAAHWIRSVKSLRDGFSKRLSKALEKQKKMMVKEQERLRANTDRISARLRSRQDLIEKMRSALMNHKREMLMDHKVQSTVLHSDLAVIEKERAEIEKAHGRVVREMAELEGSLKAVENEMRDMTRSSAVRNGRVDPSFLRKKKAVDRRFELLLRNISEKREVITTTEQKLYVYDEKKEEKESQLKSLETDLVSLLVQQQKRMLSILNTDNDDDS